MTLNALSEEHIDEIYKNKVIYSIIKFERQDEDYKELFKGKDMYAKNLNDSDINESDYDEIVAYLDQQKEIINTIRNENEEVIKLTKAQILDNFKQGISKSSDDIEKYEYIFEYVTKTISYNYDSKRFNRDIPFGNDYDFEFYKGVPFDNSFDSILVNKTGLSEDIANLISFLGKELGLTIDVVHCSYEDQSYALNSVAFGKDISFIDATSVITGRKEMEDAFLVSRGSLNNDNKYNGLGESINKAVHFGGNYNINEVIEKEKGLLPDIEYKESKFYIK